MHTLTNPQARALWTVFNHARRNMPHLKNVGPVPFHDNVEHVNVFKALHRRGLVVAVDMFDLKTEKVPTTFSMYVLNICSDVDIKDLLDQYCRQLWDCKWEPGIV